MEIVEGGGGRGKWDLSEPVRNAPCFCLLKKRDSVREEKEESERRTERWDSSERRGCERGEGAMWGKKQG